ncbi:NUDIX domain-containing protein [Actinomadura madurae]|nr:NUDIX domain-containing protein [Actinomadura madurae]
MPAALAAVRHGRHLLLVFNRHRAQWELPGGLIDPGETPYEAAVRELHEESGLHLPALTLAGYGRFHLVRPPRDEYAALYTASTTSRHTAFTPNEEISAIRWWDTATPHPPTPRSSTRPWPARPYDRSTPASRSAYSAASASDSYFCRGQKNPLSPSFRFRGTTCTCRCGTLWLTRLFMATNDPAAPSPSSIAAASRCAYPKNVPRKSPGRSVSVS